MTRIGILSDTHGYLHHKVLDYFSECDEIWHCGDWGSLEVSKQLEAFKPLRAVWGNIDGYEIRCKYSKIQRFRCEGMDVLLTHIGGYPGKYAPEVRPDIFLNPPNLFVCGHSHILKVQSDEALGLLHINPGAAGNFGFHQVQTIVRLTIDKNKVTDLEVIELQKRV